MRRRTRERRHLCPLAPNTIETGGHRRKREQNPGRRPDISISAFRASRRIVGITSYSVHDQLHPGAAVLDTQRLVLAPQALRPLTNVLCGRRLVGQLLGRRPTRPSAVAGGRLELFTHRSGRGSARTQVTLYGLNSIAGSLNITSPRRPDRGLLTPRPGGLPQLRAQRVRLAVSRPDRGDRWPIASRAQLGRS